jgi:hypothetical protein
MRDKDEFTEDDLTYVDEEMREKEERRKKDKDGNQW